MRINSNASKWFIELTFRVHASAVYKIGSQPIDPGSVVLGRGGGPRKIHIIGGVEKGIIE